MVEVPTTCSRMVPLPSKPSEVVVEPPDRYLGANFTRDGLIDFENPFS